MNDPITLIEQAIVDRIKEASKSGVLEYQLPNVATYKGEMDEDVPHLIANQSPAVWVTFVGEDNPGKTMGKPDCDLTFAVIIYVRNEKSERASRCGTSNSIGGYRLVNDIKKLLVEQDLNLPIKQIEFLNTRPLLNGKLAGYYSSIFVLTFKTRYMLDTALKPYKITEFQRIHSEWTVATNKSNININLRSKSK